MPAEDASTIAPDIAFNNLVVGHIDEKSVQTSYPGLMALISPHVFPTAIGHYSLTTEKQVLDSAGNVIPEQ
ncbi:hypothetical protein MAM1_0315c09580 [Mucor ambiguus]|uniref:Uncharacterized protein n=1 Tax=Mucor ambiguus TaxID=91626 RepID=A0A0C9MH14_9FUNG|nr:hypothetical protein MAM1_0315c09580 [Mucor ambiguus]